MRTLRNSREILADTQWPRFQVFEQPDEGKPFIHAGSVHAADNEMALLTARDVFARRPERRSMWVVRDSAILARTKEELDRQPPEPDADIDAPEHIFHVFGKRSQRGVCVQIGSVGAHTPAGALAAALKAHAVELLVWWVFPEASVVRSAEEDADSLYGSSPGKEFRHESHYPVRTMMMDLKNRKRED